MNISKADLDQRFVALQSRAEEIAQRYALGSPPNVKAIGSRTTAEETLKPDLAFLLGEINFAWGLLGQLLDAGQKMHAKMQEQAKQLAESKAPKVEVVTTQQLRMMEQARAEGRKR